MIFPVQISFIDHKYVIKQEFAKVLDVVALPVVDSFAKSSDSQFILCSSLSLIDLVCDAFGGVRASLKFFVVSVCTRRCSFDKRLKKGSAQK